MLQRQLLLLRKSILVALTAVPLQAGAQESGSDESTLREAESARQREITQALEIVNRIRSAEDQPSWPELRAIDVLGKRRSAEAVEPLLRVVRLKFARPVVVAGGREARYRSRISRINPIWNRPAAGALRQIGLPSVEAILNKVKSSDAIPSTEELRVYAFLIKYVVGNDYSLSLRDKQLDAPATQPTCASNTIAFLKFERDRAPMVAHAAFDTMIQTIRNHALGDN